MSKLQELKNKLKIDETLTKAPTKVKRKYNKVKDVIPHKEDFNFQADLLFLPTTKKGYKYLLNCVDLATDEFDTEPLKDKEPKSVLNALKTMFKRKHLNKPYASMRTDAGNEFKGVFHKYMIDEKILHKVSLPGRHTQTANIESLNRTIGKLLNGYMNSKEEKTGKPYKEWTDVLSIIREDLNKIRKKKINPKYDYPTFNPTKKPKYNVGDMVYRMLDEPRNTLNQKQIGKFREGDYRYDPVPRKIAEVLYYPGDVPYRYMLKDIKGASYAEWQLKKSDTKEEVAEIKQILQRVYDVKEKVDKYKVWFYEEKKSNAGWYLKKDLPKKLVEDFDKKKPTGKIK